MLNADILRLLSAIRYEFLVLVIYHYGCIIHAVLVLFCCHDLSCWRSFVWLVSTRGARVHALCLRYALSSPMHQPIGRQLLAPAQWDICLASQSADLQRFVWAWVSVLGINCSNLLHFTMTASFSETFLKIFSTDKLFSLDDLNDNFLELSEVIIL